MAKTRAGALVALAVLAGCSGSDLLGSRPQPTAAAPPPEAAPPAPPPVDLAGRWQLSAAAGGACFMNFADAVAKPSDPEAAARSRALSGTIAPEGGCPGSFFTSRKWAFENGRLIIRDFKNRPLAELSYSGDRFTGQDTSGTLTLSR